MRLIGKPAGAVLWEIVGPQTNRNHFFAVPAPSVDIWLTAEAATPGVAVQVFYNDTPIVRTGIMSGPVTTPIHDALNPVPGVTATAKSPHPINMAEGQQPDPSAWGAAIATITAPVGGGRLGPVNVAIAPLVTPTWIRLVLLNPGDGFVKMVTKWQ